MRFLLLSVVLLAVSSASAQGTGTIAGQVLEADGVTAVIGANVRVEGTTLGAATDMDGNYRITGVPAGAYTVTTSHAGSMSQSFSGAAVEAGRTRPLDFLLSAGSIDCACPTCCEAPVVISCGIGQSRVITGQDLERLPVRP